MPTIGNNQHTLLHGLSDFWLRFYADTDELQAFHHGTELLLAQTYLDMVSSFLNISIQDTPLFNKEFFKLILVREDRIALDEGSNPTGDRHAYLLDDAINVAQVLQNKVYDPTASLVHGGGYDLGLTDLDGDDIIDYSLRFESDPTGAPGRLISSTSEGYLLTYGTGALTRFYVVNTDTPFKDVKVGYWLHLGNSGSGNYKTYRIAQVLNDKEALLEGTFTLPDVNNGALVGSVLDSEFSPVEGFANRSLAVQAGGSFDDALRRRSTEMQSWYAAAPVGLGVRKGDIVRILDQAVVPSVPTDLTVAVVRHDKLYVLEDTPVPRDAALVQRYVVLREPYDPDVQAKALAFAETGTPKTASDGTLTYDIVEGAVKLTATAGVFEASDRQRFVTLSNTGAVQWTASLAVDGTLTWTSGTVTAPLARAAVGGSVTVTGSTAGQDGTYTLTAVESDTVAKIGTSFTPETGLTITLDSVTNAGTYKVKKVLDAPGGNNLLLDLPASYPDLNNGTITWRIHDGYQASLSPHTRIQRGTVVMHSSVGSQYTGGVREAAEGIDFYVNYETGVLTQIGRLAGTWSLVAPYAHVDYSWYREVLAEAAIVDVTIPGAVTDTINAATSTITLDATNVQTALSSTTGFSAAAHEGLLFRISNATTDAINRDYLITEVVNAYTIKVYPPPASSAAENFLTTGDGVYTQGAVASLDAADTEVQVNEVAFWAPDVEVDKFHLYNNYGYLIDRFEPSSETYREFIRGVFQLYMLGPTLERIESALNVISNLPVVRDDGEFLDEYDTTTSTEYDYVRTIRLNAESAEYAFPKGTPMRADVVAYVSGTSDEIQFEAFEPLTILFEVTDYVQDPTWWESIVIPATLMPREDSDRRTTVPVLYENIIGQIDDPRIGDPGFFIGADDEGIVPAYGDAAPAKRRKMANVVMNVFLKYNIFYVRFDSLIENILNADFVEDLRELILVAKPGYKYVYVEPASKFVDAMRILELDLAINASLALGDTLVLGDQSLTIQSGSWNIGDVWRRAASTLGIALTVADGASIPAVTNLGVTDIIAARLRNVPAPPGVQVLELRDYTINYKTGVLTPLTVWPACSATLDVSSLVVGSASGKDATLGDTDYVLGSADPSQRWSKREMFSSGTLSTVNGDKLLADPSAEFLTGLHEGSWVHIHNRGVAKILRVVSLTQVLINRWDFADGSSLVWFPRSDEPVDGEIYTASSKWFLRSPSGNFRSHHVGRYLYVEKTLNPGCHYRIVDVPHVYEVELEQLVAPRPLLVAETGVMWQLRGGSEQLDLVERPLQIAIS